MQQKVKKCVVFKNKYELQCNHSNDDKEHLLMTKTLQL